jgi:hypothetical protein
MKKDAIEKAEVARAAIVLKHPEDTECRLYYCPGCKEIFHDRNYPVNLPQCLHFLCQHCIKL